MKRFATLILCAVSGLIAPGSHLRAQQLPEPEYNLKPLFDKYGIFVRDQGGRGTCSVFAIVGIMEFEYANQLGQDAALSVEYLNWASNRITGVNEDGSFFSDALAGILKYGICEDTLFPYYSRNYTPKVAPSEAAIKDAKKRRKAEVIWIKQWDPNVGMTADQIEQVKAEIRLKHPVAIGFQWPKGEERWRRMENGMMTVPPREGVFDGHSIIMAGYRDDPSAPGGGWFLFKNSHGTSYGEDGYGRMPFEYLAKYANDGVWVKVGKFAGQAECLSLADLDSSKIQYGQGASKDALTRQLITLDGRGLSFRATVAAPVSGAVEYVVMGDRNQLWKSGILKSGDKPVKVDIKLKEIHKLGLLVMNRGKEEPAGMGWTGGSIEYGGCAPVGILSTN